MSDRPDSDPRVVAGTPYLVDLTRPMPDAGGGVAAFAASSRQNAATQLMATRVDRFAPARSRPLQSLAGGIEGLLTPLGHGLGPPIDGRPAYFVVSTAPPGPPLSAELQPWSEQPLIELVMKPIALILEQLQSRGVTHRAIRLNNVFHGGPNRPVILGPAWAAPPAMHQPAIYETAYTSICHPTARGDGRIADDVYALGVLLLTLALGHQPMDGVDDRTVMSRKQEFGDFAALAGNERLPPMLSDILRGMLAEDPEHRPSATLLRDPVGARGRRVAARPPHRAQRSFKLGMTTVWNTRTLALGMALEPDEALASILNGAMMYWLRRGLGDSALAVKLEELVRQHAVDLSSDKITANATLVMRAIVDADILMPLCWRGVAMVPDGLGSALATEQRADPGLHRKLMEIVATEAQGIWAAMREERAPSASHRVEARQRRSILQIKGPAGGLPRLAYTLNSQTPCASPLLEGRWVVNCMDLTPALDAVAIASPEADLIDPHVAAFIGARSERWLDQEVKALAGGGDEGEQALVLLRLLAELQARYHPGPLTGLTSWIAHRCRPLVERWQNRERRSAVEDQLKSLTEAGFLRPMLLLLEDQSGHDADSQGLLAAVANLASLNAELNDIADGSARRGAVATRLGQEIAAGLALAAVATTLLLAAIG